MTIRIEAAVICDEVRTETSGKHIIIGAYGGFLGVSRLPINLRPALWLQIYTDPGEYKFQYRIVGPNNAQLLAGEVQFGVQKSGLAALVFPRQQIQLQSAGSLRFEWKQKEDDEGKTIKEIPIVDRSAERTEKATSSVSSASEPPA